jgi:hypothetical protein
MKLESDKEIDGLLRRHARRKAASAEPEAVARRAGGKDVAEDAARASVFGAHLDADEMNAYAENVLPDGARARYVAHLADCDECRGLVTQLTLAANVADTSSASAAAIVEASPKRSWREWLAALLAPPVLRYAVPAIALMAVMVVAFVALRERRNDANLVAQNEQTQASKSQAPDFQHDRPAETGTATTTTSNTAAANAPVRGNAANTNPNAQPLSTPEADAPAAAAKAPEKAAEPNAAAPKSAPQPIEQEARGSGVLFGRQQQRSDDDKNVAETEKPAPAPPPADLAASNAAAGRDESVFREESARKSAGIAKAKTGSPATATTTRDNNYVLDGVESKQPVGGARRAPQASARARGNVNNADQSSGESAGPSAKDERNGKKEDSETETRSVGGRAFRNRGGVWIDTAYNSSRSTVNVRRSSEQYRALVADEPGIGNIVNQLGSPVIIVWKSRAYRIY